MTCNFGVFYTCYTENDAIEYNLKALYSIYPDCPVYLVSDGGNDFAYLEKQYSSLKTSLEGDTRGWCQGSGASDYLVQNQNYKTNPEIHQKLYDTAYAWMERQQRAIEFCKKDHMLVMEPDVLIRGKLNIPKKTKLMGPMAPNITPEAGWRHVLSKIDGAVDVYSWGWPYIYESKAFTEVFSFVKNNESIFRDFLMSDYRFGSAGDVTIPVLFAACGYSPSINPDVTECLRNPGWRTSGHPLLHQYRDAYPQVGSGYSGTHAK